MAAFIKQRQQTHQTGQGGNQPPNTQINISQLQQGASQMMSSMTSGGVPNQNMGGMQQGGPMAGMQQGGGGQVGMQQGGGGQGGAPGQPGMGMQQGMMQQRYRPINLQQHQGQFGAGGGGGAAQFQQPAPPYQTANMGGGPRGMNPGGFQRDAMGGMGDMRQPGPGGMMQSNMLNQQMLNQVRSPSPGMQSRSPNPAASPRPSHPGMVQSPHNNSPHHVGAHMGGGGQVGGGGEDVNGSTSVMMLGQQTSMASNMNIQTSMMDSTGGQGGGQEAPSMTPQDQLSKFVETL